MIAFEKAHCGRIFSRACSSTESFVASATTAHTASANDLLHSDSSTWNTIIELWMKNFFVIQTKLQQETEFAIKYYAQYSMRPHFFIGKQVPIRLYEFITTSQSIQHPHRDEDGWVRHDHPSTQKTGNLPLWERNTMSSNCNYLLLSCLWNEIIILSSSSVLQNELNVYHNDFIPSTTFKDISQPSTNNNNNKIQRSRILTWKSPSPLFCPLTFQPKCTSRACCCQPLSKLQRSDNAEIIVSTVQNDGRKLVVSLLETHRRWVQHSQHLLPYSVCSHCADAYFIVVRINSQHPRGGRQA